MEWEVAGKGSGQNPPNGAAPSSTPGPEKKKRKWWKTALIVIVALFLLVNISNCGSKKNSAESSNLSWPTSGLAAQLPKPESNKGKIDNNSDTSFRATVAKYDDAKYAKYVDACKEKGFTVDAESGTTSSGYDAFNENGDKLELDLYSSSKEMHVSLTAAKELKSIEWPTTGAGALAPKPASTIGAINSNSDTAFSATIGDTSLDAFSSYADACNNAGFNIDAKKSEKYYSASNADGFTISVKYEGASRISISVKAPEQKSGDGSSSNSAASSSASSATSSSASSSSASSKIKELASALSSDSSNSAQPTDFRSTIDSYEAFMNKYVDFMTKYKDSGSPASMFVDYTKMLKQYNDYSKQVAALDDGTLSTDDLNYLNDANLRIAQRLAEIPQ